MKVVQAGRPLPPMSLSILVGLTLRFDSLCIIVNVVETYGLLLYFLADSLERFVFVGTSRNVMIQ